jgi:putative lumazine-binding protein
MPSFIFRSATTALIVLAAAATTVPRSLRAQDADHTKILTTVQKVFDAMRTRDTALLSHAFDSTARLVGVSTRGAAPAVSLTAPSQFGAAIARAPAGDVWNERIYDPEVRIDGDVAQVWAYYTFHRNSTFSHCGVDAFMLVKVADAWKITQLADSRRTTGCTRTDAPKAP